MCECTMHIWTDQLNDKKLLWYHESEVSLGRFPIEIKTEIRSLISCCYLKIYDEKLRDQKVMLIVAIVYKNLEVNVFCS